MAIKKKQLRVCICCKEEKELSKNFHFRDGRYLTTCKPCYRINDLKSWRKRAERNRQIIWEHKKKHGCIDCGEKNPILLQFDHANDKADNISNLIQSASESTLMAEVSKCDLRCSNCHASKTARDQKWYINQLKKDGFTPKTWYKKNKKIIPNEIRIQGTL